MRFFIKEKRILSLDLLRGLFIVLMLTAHSIFFFHTRSNPLLNSLSGIGDFVSFTGFLLASGAAGYIAYIHYRHPTHSIVRRLSKRLSVYLLGYFLISLYADAATSGWSVTEAFKIITLQKLVPFTEFILTLIILGLLKLPLRKFYDFLSRSLPLTLLVMVLTYQTGNFLKDLTLPVIPQTWQLILFGAQGYYAFPLFQYFPVYLLGIYLGRQFWINKSTRQISLLSLALSASASIISIIHVSFSSLLAQPIELAEFLQRWPPSVSFIGASLAATLALLAVLVSTHDLKRHKIIRIFLLLVGQNAFGIYFSHTFLLFLGVQLGLKQTHSLLIFLLLWFSSTAFAVILTKILPFNYSFKLTLIDITHEAEKVLRNEGKNKPSFWQFLLKKANVGSLLSISIGKRTYRLLRPRNLVLALALVLVTSVPLGVAENNLYLEKNISPLKGEINRKWILAQDKNRELVYTISIPESLITDQGNVSVTYSIDGGPNLELEKDRELWVTKVPINDLETGKHVVITSIKFNNRSFKTQPTEFYISEPVLVTWTIDWEGYDANDVYLQSLASISQDFSLPMTHLFNPRIYTSEEISPERVQKLTDWVINRRDKNRDEIGLHLHMFPDFVEKAGVDVRLDPVWGGGFTEGYDILTTAYTYDELKRIYTYARTLFETHNLGVPRTYRAGAWFANTETLKALSDSGFLVDTSGRTKYQFGTNSVPGYWDLKSTSQPYHPSIADQNSDHPAPNLEILEVPNNGADSYAYTADEMLVRFTDNYSGGALNEPLVVTFLSHPHWFNPARQETMRKVFTDISNYSYENDLGPVINTTLMGVYSLWMER